MALRANNNVLAEIEWDEGLSMPVANAENKELENEVQQKQGKIVAYSNEVEETGDRIRAMAEHLKNVRQELQHTQSLVNARSNESDTEDHLLKIAQREEGRLKQEVGRLKKEMDELKEKRNTFENTIFKQTQRLEEMKSQMNWDQQALEAWLEESARKDEDSMTIQKYTRQDESKIKELSLRMEKLMTEALEKKHLLDNEVTTTLTSQIELDKIAEDFRKAHEEREQLLSQWEYTIEQMQRRDREMDILSAKLAKAKQEVRRHKSLIAEKKQFLEQEMENNAQQEKRIAGAERTSARVRADLQEQELEKTQFEDELNTLKRTVDRTAVDLETTRGTVSQLKKDIGDKTKKLVDSKNLRDALVEKLKVSIESTMTAEAKALQMEEMLDAEERNQEEMLREMKILGDVMFKKEGERSEARTDEKMTEASISGSHNAIKNLNSKITKLDTDALKQQEILYSQDFTLQQLERRCVRMQGESNSGEKEILESKVMELQEDLDRKNDTHALLTGQLKKVQDDLRYVNRQLDNSKTEKEDLTIKIDELNLYNDNSEAELRKLVKSKQSYMVEENLLKLEIKKLRDLLNMRADDTLGLEKRKLQLDTAMKERQQEIKIHKEMLTAQVKATDEERQQISAELHERISKIDKLKKRYEILMVSMAPPEGEEEKSQAYYVIKAAQEKEELQREGDDLDARIRKAEKEIRALENTLRLMNGRNEQYRKSFNKITDASDEMDEKRQLDEQMRAVMDKYKYKRRQIREIQDDLHTMSSTLDNLSRDEDAYVGMIEDKKKKVLQITKEIDDQRSKLERVNKQNVRYCRDLRTTRKVKEELPEEKDFEVRQLREFNKTSLKMLGDACGQYPDMSDAVSMYLSQANIPTTALIDVGGGSGNSSARSSARGSAMSSARGSVASRSAVGSSTKMSPVPINIGAGLDAGSTSRRSSLSSGRSQASSRR